MHTTIFVSTADEDIVEQCRVREDNIAHEKYQNELIMTLTIENENLSNENQDLSSKNNNLSNKNKNLSSENIRLRKILEEHGIKA